MPVLSLSLTVLPVAVSKVEGGGTQANVREGGMVTFSCTVTANPKVYSVSWYHNVSDSLQLSTLYH